MKQSVYDFERLVEAAYPNDSDLYAFVKDLHEGILIKDENGKLPEPDPDIVHFSNGTESFGYIICFVGPIIYAWANNVLNRQRNRQEFDEVKERVEYIKQLTDTGMPLEVAEGLVKTSLDAIAKRNHDDPAIKKIVQLAQKANDHDALPSPNSE